MFHRFTDHPNSVGETYLQHAATAARFGAELIRAGAACLVHAAFPWTFETTASRLVGRLHAQMEARRTAPRSDPTGTHVLDFAI